VGIFGCRPAGSSGRILRWPRVDPTRCPNSAGLCRAAHPARGRTHRRNHRHSPRRCISVSALFRPGHCPASPPDLCRSISERRGPSARRRLSLLCDFGQTSAPIPLRSPTSSSDPDTNDVHQLSASGPAGVMRGNHCQRKSGCGEPGHLLRLSAAADPLLRGSPVAPSKSESTLLLNRPKTILSGASQAPAVLPPECWSRNKPIRIADTLYLARCSKLLGLRRHRHMSSSEDLEDQPHPPPGLYGNRRLGRYSCASTLLMVGRKATQPHQPTQARHPPWEAFGRLPADRGTGQPSHRGR
jgi:hypothetical protein